MTAVICLGEIVIDWIRTTLEDGVNPEPVFERHLAGVPANVAVGLARQDVAASFIGRVGDDPLGHWAKAQLAEEGVDTSGLVFDGDAVTRQAFVARKPDGERQSLSVTMDGCADVKLAPTDLHVSQFEQAQALYFDSTSLSTSPIADAVGQALEMAKGKNLLVVSDANIWPAMWAGDDVCRATVLEHLKHIDLLKVTESELEFLTGSASLQSAEKLRQEKAMPVLVVTLGGRGAFVTSASGSAHVPPLPVQLAEAAGAGDGFVAALLAALLPVLNQSSSRRQQLSELPLATLVELVRRGNAAGAIVCSRLGALSAMPSTSEIDELLRRSLW